MDSLFGTEVSLSASGAEVAVAVADRRLAFLSRYLPDQRVKTNQTGEAAIYAIE
jgi:hypothetical protein